MKKTVTLSLEEREVLIFALGVMLGKVDANANLLGVTNALLQKLECKVEEEEER